MKSVSAVKARQGLGMLLNRVQLRHESFVIERAGKKVAILQAYEEPDMASTMRDGQHMPEGKLDIRNIAGLGSEIWKSVEVDDYIATERGEWV